MGTTQIRYQEYHRQFCTECRTYIEIYNTMLPVPIGMVFKTVILNDQQIEADKVNKYLKSV